MSSECAVQLLHSQQSIITVYRPIGLHNSSLSMCSLDPVAPTLNLPERVVRQPPATNALLTCVVDANPPGDVYWQRDRDGLRPVVYLQPQPTLPGPASIAPPSSIAVSDAASSKFRVQTWPISRDGYTKLVGAFIENIGDDDLGSYTCYVRNEFGSAEVKLSVTGQ